MRRMMMPPPPPAVVLVRASPTTDHAVKPVLQTVENHINNSVHAALKREKLLMISQELRASIALTEMKQERFRLRKLSSQRSGRRSDTETDHSSLFKEIFTILNLIEELSLEPSPAPSASKEDKPVIASLGGARFHNPECVVVERIPKEKRLSFSNDKEALKAGYMPCSICVSSDSSLIGSKEHAKVHHSSCLAVRNINNRNAVSFSSEKEAFDLGFSPCKLCMHD